MKSLQLRGSTVKWVLHDVTDASFCGMEGPSVYVPRPMMPDTSSVSGGASMTSEPEQVGVGVKEWEWYWERYHRLRVDSGTVVFAHHSAGGIAKLAPLLEECVRHGARVVTYFNHFSPSSRSCGTSSMLQGMLRLYERVVAPQLSLAVGGRSRDGASVTDGSADGSGSVTDSGGDDTPVGSASAVKGGAMWDDDRGSLSRWAASSGRSGGGSGREDVVDLSASTDSHSSDGSDTRWLQTRVHPTRDVDCASEVSFSDDSDMELVDAGIGF
jgi:hypothetical protein